MALTVAALRPRNPGDTEPVNATEGASGAHLGGFRSLGFWVLIRAG